MYRKKSKKILILLVMILVVGISVGYAVLNSTLKINGTSKIKKNAWDVHFENIFVKEGSVTPAVEPTISDNTTISNFELTLDKPGDFYEFYVDVVNEGTIDAMIDSVVKTPDLTETQKKYINYIIEYQNGEQIAKNDLVNKNSFVRLKVLVEYKKDLTASDLPTEDEALNLGFTLNLVQSDGTGKLIEENGVSNKLVKVVYGLGTNLGDEVCIGEECFYVMFSDDETITMITKYNLEVGNMKNENGEVVPIENPSGLQSELTAQVDDDGKLTYGTIAFSESAYWLENGAYLPNYEIEMTGTVSGELSGEMSIVYVYDNNSLLYPHFENYKTYLMTQGLNVEEIRTFSFTDYQTLGEIINNYESSGKIFDESYIAENFITNFWSGSAWFGEGLFALKTSGDPGAIYDNNDTLGAKPVIKIPKSELYK